jgi:hypothetical protein
MRLAKSLLVVVVLAGLLAPAALAFRFSDHTRNMPVGTVGQPFSHPIETVAGCKGVYMNIEGGDLPPGLQLVGTKQDLVDGSDWRIVGTPTQAGTWGFYIRARNLCPADSTEEDFKITIVGGSGGTPPPPPPPPPPAPSAVTIQPTTLPAAATGADYSAKLTATGGTSQTWSPIGGALPSGISLSADGTLSGRPAIAGVYTFTVRVQSSAGAAQRAFTIVVRDGVSASIQPTKQAEQGVALTLRPAFAGGVAPHAWTLASGALPAGVTLDRATGALTGTPTAAGTFPLTLTVTDSQGVAASVQTQFVVNAPIALATRSLGMFTRGVFSSRTLVVTGGVGKKHFKVTSGRLPLGLRLNVNGVLVGTPRSAGRSVVTVTVTDGYKVTSSRTFVLVVRR